MRGCSIKRVTMSGAVKKLRGCGEYVDGWMDSLGEGDVERFSGRQGGCVSLLTVMMMGVYTSVE